MRLPEPLHPWNLTPAEAITLQRELADRVERDDRLSAVRFIAGIDISTNRFTNLGRAAVVILSYPALEEIEVARHEETLRMPYVPGLLSFREIPVILGALAWIKQTPDLLLVDGQGIAHPRRIGIATHLGVYLDLPSIGCAKSILRGKPDPLPDVVGSQAPMRDRGEVVGMALRTRLHANPIYVSTGHRVSLETAVRYVESCLRNAYRLPIPTRLAHIHAAEPTGMDSGDAPV